MGRRQCEEGEGLRVGGGRVRGCKEGECEGVYWCMKTLPGMFELVVTPVSCECKERRYVEGKRGEEGRKWKYHLSSFCLSACVGARSAFTATTFTLLLFALTLQM